MKISVIGSWSDNNPDWPMSGSHADFKEACYEIGRAFGRFRQPIVVGGQSSNTADFHVVHGMADELQRQQVPSPLIEVLRPLPSRGDSTAYEDLAKKNPSLFSFHIPTPMK